MPEPFSVCIERTGRIQRLAARGELDIATVPALKGEIDAASAIDPGSVIVVDLTELTFIDSTGLHLLLRLGERFPQRLRVISDSPGVERLLDLSGARDRLPIIPKTADPLAPLP